MRPKDLKFPHKTEDSRDVFIDDRIMCVPKYMVDYQSFSFPGWESKELFGNDNPVYVEYCSGNGTWICEKAIQNPNINWVAVEMKFKRVRKIWSKLKNHKLNNLFVMYTEAYLATKLYFPNDSLSGVYVNFPDPWPKRRHAKNRLVNPSFIALLADKMKTGSFFKLMTDDKDYSTHMIETFQENECYQTNIAYPYYQMNPVDYGKSYFDTLWRKLGKTVYLHHFQRLTPS